jgi:hypothetical protein
MTRREPRIVRHDDDIFGEGAAVYEDELPRERTSEAYGRHAANAVIAATSKNTGSGKRTGRK